MRPRLLIGSSALAAFAASLCCILPLAALGGVATLGLAAAFEPWRPWLLAVTALLFGAGAIKSFLDYRRGCAAGSACASKPFSVMPLGLLSLVILAVALFPSYAGLIGQARAAQNGPVTNGAALKTLTMSISGMTCAACAKGLQASFLNLPGVKSAKVDYDAKQAVISFDPARQNTEALKKLVSDTGYKVVEAH